MAHLQDSSWTCLLLQLWFLRLILEAHTSNAFPHGDAVVHLYPVAHLKVIEGATNGTPP